MRIKTKRRLINGLAVLMLSAAATTLLTSFLNSSSTELDRTPGFDIASGEFATGDAASITWTPEDFRDLLKIRLQGKPAEPVTVADQPREIKPAEIQPETRQRKIELPPSIVLKGILYHPQFALAMFEVRGQNRVVSCAPGEEISGARVSHISADQVLLNYRGKEFIQRLEASQ